MKRLSHVSLIILISTLSLQSACSMKKMTTNVLGKISTEGMVALEGEQDVAFAREAAPALIKTLEVLSHGNPKDARSLMILSQSYGQFAFGFLEEEMLSHSKESAAYAKARAQANLFYGRGLEFGKSALIRRTSMRNAFNKPISEFGRALRPLTKKDVPALFWSAFNWANYLNLNLDDPEAIAALPRIQTMLGRIIDLDPKFHHGAAHAINGVIAAMRPKMLGGDPALSLKEFEEAMTISPGYLMTKVMFAQYYARQIQDVELFRKTLKEVLMADASAVPEQRLANELAKRRARLLLKMEKELF